jgi:CRISPR-associated protein Csm4
MTMRNYRVYLRPKSSFVTWPTSDTIFGALCWAIYHIYGEIELEKMLKDFNQKPRFILSSSFPYILGKNYKVHFFPKPLIKYPKSTDIENIIKSNLIQMGKSDFKSLDYNKEFISFNEKFKEINKIFYISESIFYEFIENYFDIYEICYRLRGKGNTEKDLEKIGNTLISFKERENLDPQRDLQNLFKEYDVMGNQIERVGGSTVEGLLFYKKETSFEKIKGGLWFIVKTDDFDFLKPLFRYLEDTGIGGKRTIGKGHFEVSWEETPFELPEGKEPDSFIILSRWFPAEDELDFITDYASWNLINLRPKRDTMFPSGMGHILKGLLRVFTEGSIFPLKNFKEYYGKLVPSGNMGTYTAYHNGMALPIFVKIGERK